ncbi:SDR family NAD(P)-dependent oxidoreductase [Bdellovibrio sp. HCB209]|uniref:SDR family NAD(P)-dependent oxidoreductase n=1 Tax=Bdellovibrio sp. HCB209 TaxID=3394354 RepID=UPI0039B5D164
MRTVLITGVGSGLGKALMHTFLKKGYRVLGICRSDLNSNQKELQIFKADLGDPLQVQRLAEQIPWGSVDLLVNNAGYSMAGSFMELSQEDIHGISQVNYLTPLKLMKDYLTGRPSGGMIVNISSMTALIPMPRNGAYSAAKGALSISTEILRRELNDSWKIIEVCPVTIATPFHQKMGSASKTSGALHLDPEQLSERIVVRCESGVSGGYFPDLVSKILGLCSMRLGFLLSRILFRK